MIDYYSEGYNAGKNDEDPKPPDKFKFPQFFAEYQKGFLDGQHTRTVKKEIEIEEISKIVLNDNAKYWRDFEQNFTY